MPPFRLPTIATLSLAALLLAGCSRSSESAPVPSAPKVVVAPPVSKTIVDWNDFTGRLEAVNYVEIRSRVSGYLKSVEFEEGQDVQKDQLLLVIDPRPFEAELAQAEAGLEEVKARLQQSQSQLAQALAEKKSAESQLTLTRTEYERLQRIGNAVAKSAVDEAEADYLQAQAGIESRNAGIALAHAAIATSTAAIESAKAAVAQAELNLEYTKIKAPVAGRISRKNVTEGNLISGGSEQSTLLTTIVSLDPIYLTFDASEQQVLRFMRMVQQGSRRSARDVRYPAYLALADETGFPHEGFIDFVDNRFDTDTATMTARARFPNPDRLLTPGMFGKVRIAASPAYDALLVPDAAIGTDQSQQFVYVVGDGNEVAQRVVETGPLSHGLRVIRGGLSASDRVVIEGLQRVRPGASVEPVAGTVVAGPDEAAGYESVPTEKN